MFEQENLLLNEDLYTKENNGGLRRTISIVVPAYNEEDVLEEFHNRLSSVLSSQPYKAEILYVNDGSRDNTMEILYKLKEKDPRVGIIDLSRNFGKEIAMSAGLDKAIGDAVILIDADLQDPPEVIPELINKWQTGYDVVYAKRIARDGETQLKKATAFLFYRIMRMFSKVEIPADTGDFRILSRRALNSLKRLREQHRFMKGLFSWIGYKQTSIPYKRDARYAGQTKWNYWKLWNFALEGITSFTIAPLKVASYTGIAVALASFFFALFIIFKTLIYGDPVHGYPSLIVVILFLGGIQLISLGVIGEYLGRTFNEVKDRPLYFLKGDVPSALSEELLDDVSK
jgi:polyisoprenyl-phosphate glycosyltransferase